MFVKFLFFVRLKADISDQILKRMRVSEFFQTSHQLAKRQRKRSLKGLRGQTVGICIRKGEERAINITSIAGFTADIDLSDPHRY